MRGLIAMACKSKTGVPQRNQSKLVTTPQPLYKTIAEIAIELHVHEVYTKMNRLYKKLAI